MICSMGVHELRTSVDPTYFVGFMTIGVAKNDNIMLTEVLYYVDSGFQRLNLLLLLLNGFPPFPTSVMSEYLSLVERREGGEHVAVMFFGVILLLISLVLLLLMRYAEHEKLFADNEEERNEETTARYQLVPSLVLYGVAILCGLFLPYLAVSLYVLIGVFLLLPIRMLLRLLRRDGGDEDRERPSRPSGLRLRTIQPMMSWRGTDGKERPAPEPADVLSRPSAASSKYSFSMRATSPVDQWLTAPAPRASAWSRSTTGARGWR